MADITSHLPSRPATAVRLRFAQWLLLSVFLACGCWVAVNEATAKDRCETILGRLAVRLRLDLYFSNCRCMQHSLDFSDACNSGYLVLIGSRPIAIKPPA
jgi:hypothetical protein